MGHPDGFSLFLDRDGEFHKHILLNTIETTNVARQSSTGGALKPSFDMSGAFDGRFEWARQQLEVFLPVETMPFTKRIFTGWPIQALFWLEWGFTAELEGAT